MRQYSYLATCPAGFESEAARLIHSEWNGAEILRSSGGAVWFSVPAPLGPLTVPEYVTNVFYVLREWNASTYPFAELVKQSARKSSLDILPDSYAPRSFRVRFSRENRFESVDKGVTAAAERLISEATGAVPDRLGSGGEYWYIVRSESWSAFALRLERGSQTPEIPAKGELTAALASLIVLRAARGLSPGVILDPCAGHGALPDRSSSFFPLAKILAGDIDGGAVAHMERKFSNRPNVTVIKCDMRTLEAIVDSSVDLMIADPPWGMWEEGGFKDGEGISRLYDDLLSSAARVLSSGGRLCVLTGAKRDFEAAVAANGRFAPASAESGYRTDILVNGKKAALYCLDA